MQSMRGHRRSGEASVAAADAVHADCSPLADCRSRLPALLQKAGGALFL
jgi:hypothetical protein